MDDTVRHGVELVAEAESCSDRRIVFQEPPRMAWNTDHAQGSCLAR